MSSLQFSWPKNLQEAPISRRRSGVVSADAYTGEKMIRKRWKRRRLLPATPFPLTGANRKRANAMWEDDVRNVTRRVRVLWWHVSACLSE